MDELRARYHFQPEKNWMNDPNGPVVIDGKLHLFYQYNPFGAVWGNMTWGHAVAEDLVRWTHLPCALHPDQPYDKDGVFSGCCVMKDGLPHILYTGVKPETQCLAVGKKLRERAILKNMSTTPSSSVRRARSSTASAIPSPGARTA